MVNIKSEKAKALKLIKEGATPSEHIKGVKMLLEHVEPGDILFLLENRRNGNLEDISEELDKILEEKGIGIDLKKIVSDDWFENMLRNIEGFEEVCDLIGYRFVAFAMIAGVNLKSVNHNPQFPAESTVEFTIGNEPYVHEMSLEEFRKTLLVSILSPDIEEEIKLSPEPKKEEIIHIIGARYFLLAPIYGLKLKKLYVVEPSRGKEGYIIRFDRDSRIEESTIKELREAIRKMVAREEVGEKEPAGRFSPNAIPLAEKALEAGNPSRALEHLRDWILFVRNYRIGGTVAQLMHEPEPHFERGLLLVGRAYRLLNRNKIAEDFLRFSIQLLPNARKKPVFLFELSQIMFSEGRYGEAIGPLRRARKLGISKSLVYPLLGKCFLECKRNVAAFVVLGELNREGLLDKDSKLWYEEAKRRLGDAISIIENIPSPQPADEDLTIPGIMVS